MTVPWIFYHGTDVDSALYLLNGGDLDAAAAASRKIDGPPGFFLATEYEDAAFFAHRRGGAVLRCEVARDAVAQLNAAGAIQQPIPFGGGAPLRGTELVVPESAFGLFNRLRTAGKIKVTPEVRP